MTQTDVPDCRWCKRMHWPHRTCDAFPEGIPQGIYYGGQSHHTPINGDGGALFEVAGDEALEIRGYGPYPEEREKRAKQAALYAMEKEHAEVEYGTLLCWSCAHYGPEKGTCRAFPQRIPLEIVSGEVEHREPIDGDGGLTYKRRPENAALNR